MVREILIELNRFELIEIWFREPQQGPQSQPRRATAILSVAILPSVELVYYCSLTNG